MHFLPKDKQMGLPVSLIWRCPTTLMIDFTSTANEVDLCFTSPYVLPNKQFVLNVDNQMPISPDKDV